jgi:LPXTG-motif cell wall-anchored protein
MKLGRWATLFAGSLLAVGATAMTGNAAFADEPPTLDVKGADTIVPGTPYDVQFVFTNDKARDLSKGEFAFIVANFDASDGATGDNAKPTTEFKTSEVAIDYKAGGSWTALKLVGDETDPAGPLFGFVGGVTKAGPSATDDKAKTATYEFRVTLKAPTKLSTLSVIGDLGPQASESTLLRRAAASPKMKALDKGSPDTSDWAIGGKVLTVQQPSASPSPTPSTPANAGGGGSLPTTGASTGLLAGGGALLILAGAAVTVATRRRRTTGSRHAS